MGRRVHAEGRRERTKEKKIKAHTKDFSDSALSPHSSPTPSLPFVQGRNSQCRSFPLPPGCGAGQSPDSGVPGSQRHPRGASQPSAGFARGGRSCPGSLHSPRGQGSGAAGRLRPEGPEPSLRRCAAEPRRAALRAGGSWRSAQPRSCHPCPPGARSPARTRQGTGKEQAMGTPHPRGPSRPLPYPWSPSARTPPNSFKVVLSPWAPQKKRDPSSPLPPRPLRPLTPPFPAPPAAAPRVPR